MPKACPAVTKSRPRALTLMCRSMPARDGEGQVTSSRSRYDDDDDDRRGSHGNGAGTAIRKVTPKRHGAVAGSIRST
jgi:hypothetical protein